MKQFSFLLILSILSCSPASKFKKDKALFDFSEIKKSFKSVADMNDAHFVIKENNFFEFYRLLFDSVKNSSYPGRFTRKGDTLLLHFYDKKAMKLLGSRALVDSAANKITFFN